MTDTYFTVVYVLKDGQQLSDILGNKEFGEDYVFASVGDCTESQDDEEHY